MRRLNLTYPIQELKSALDLIKAFADAKETELPWKDLATRVKHEPEGGAFRKRNVTARAFGLITFGSGLSKLTPLGREVVDNAFDKESLARAFMHVWIFKKVFFEFHDNEPPLPNAISTEFKKAGVPDSEVGKVKNVFLRSARLAGLIDEEGRIVQKEHPVGMIPKVTPLSYSARIMPTPLIKPMELDKPVAANTSPDEAMSALMSLIKRLPPLDEKIGPKRRKNIIEAFTSTINFLYPEEE